MRTEVSIRPATGILTASLAVVLLAAVHPCAAAAERGTITLRGNVLGASGLPLENTWVFTKGSRRVSALSGPDGSYVLEIPGGTVAELLHAPLELRIEAQRKGWWIRLADGQPELLLELRLLVDSTGTARLRVRSSDPKMAAAVAEKAVLAGAATATLDVDFRGEPEPSPGPRNARLTAVEEVVLNGLDLPPGQPTSARSGPIVIPTGLRAGTRTSGRNVEAPEKSGTTPEMIPSPDETPPAPPRTTDETKSSNKPAGVAPMERPKNDTRAKQEERQRKKEERAMERERAKEAKRAKREVRGKKNGHVVTPPVTPAPEPAPASGASPRVYRPAEPANGGPLAEPRVYNPAQPHGDRPPENGGGEGPRVYNPAESSSRRPSVSPEPRAPRVVRVSRTALDDSTVTPADTTAVATTPASSTTATKPSSAPAPVKSEPRAAPARSETRPARPSNPAPARAASPAPDAEPDAWCTCRVEGFVEVQSEQRINGFLRVRVWLEDHPEIRGEVELFMGSPRSFVLRSVPCGPHRIRFEALSKQAFDLVSPDPKVDCTDGGMRQVRLVLEPSKRRGR